jgi:electron transfer flavoprotein beta subunit
MLAALLLCGQATFASKVAIADGKATVTREVDGGLQTLELRLPAVVTADLRLNTPRFTALPNIIKARSKPLTKTTAADLGVDLTPRLKTLRVEEPLARGAGEILASVDDLIAKLRAAEVLP